MNSKAGVFPERTRDRRGFKMSDVCMFMSVTKGQHTPASVFALKHIISSEKLQFYQIPDIGFVWRLVSIEARQMTPLSATQPMGFAYCYLTKIVSFALEGCVHIHLLKEESLSVLTFNIKLCIQVWCWNLKSPVHKLDWTFETSELNSICIFIDSGFFGRDIFHSDSLLTGTF